MITRRTFISTTAATASSALPLKANCPEPGREPLRAGPRVRKLYAQPSDDGRLLLVSDGPKTPPKLVTSEALERAFGRGVEETLSQPDHWRMIEEGWFSGDDIYDPTDPDDPALFVWQTHYRPEIEAYDLLRDLFRDRIRSPFGVYIAELGFELAEHPYTPRYATAKLDDEFRLSYFAVEVARRTSAVVIEPSAGQGEIMR